MTFGNRASENWFSGYGFGFSQGSGSGAKVSRPLPADPAPALDRIGCGFESAFGVGMFKGRTRSLKAPSVGSPSFGSHSLTPSTPVFDSSAPPPVDSAPAPDAFARGDGVFQL